MHFIISTAQGRNSPNKVNLVRSSIGIDRFLSIPGVPPVPYDHFQVCRRPRKRPQWYFFTIFLVIVCIWAVERYNANNQFQLAAAQKFSFRISFRLKTIRNAFLQSFADSSVL